MQLLFTLIKFPPNVSLLVKISRSFGVINKEHSAIKMLEEYGTDFDKNWPEDYPKSVPKYSEFGMKLLTDCKTMAKKPEPLSIQEIITISDAFPIKFPIQTCRIKSQPKSRLSLIEQQAASAYPVIHERVLWLYIAFLEQKLKYGSEIEKKVYENISVMDLIDRLLKKRCASFFGKNDQFQLVTGETGYNCHKEQHKLESKFEPFSLYNLISYDEIKLGALLSISSNTEFINNGTRTNKGVPVKDRSTIESDGVIFGFIGARLTKADEMEFQEIIITSKQNVVPNGYGSEPLESSISKDLERKHTYRNIWNKFYDEKSLLFEHIKKPDGHRFSVAKVKEQIFDNVAMKKRYTISFDTLLLDSQARAEQLGRKALIHIVGIGLGVWKSAEHQEIIFLKVFKQRIKYLLGKLKNIGWLHFSWFHTNACGDIKDGNIIKSSENPDGIKIFLSKRNPADKLVGIENYLLVVSYAWDGNALPGNEFWMGKLASTGDSSTACSTLVTELHNPHINRTMVSGQNLHIVSVKYGLQHLSDYAKSYLTDVSG